MTTIAWDGKMLAGDRQSTHDGTPTRTRKVFKVKANNGKSFLVGCAGDTAECVAIVRWLQGRIEKPSLSNSVAVLIDDKGRPWAMNEKAVMYRIGIKRWAIGSGANYALGAMAAGKSAREAVRIASRLDTHTGLGVDVVTL